MLGVLLLFVVKSCFVFGCLSVLAFVVLMVDVGFGYGVCFDVSFVVVWIWFVCLECLLFELFSGFGVCVWFGVLPVYFVSVLVC